MVGSAHIGHLIGRQFGTYLGRQIALGACRDDRDDELARRVFTARLSPSQIPSAVDLRPWTTPVEDQGQLGSCAANALVGALEYLVRRETGKHVDLSRLFVYFNQRLVDDCVRDDLGASIGDGVRVLSRLGAPSERSWPYARDLFAVQPPEPIFREALRVSVVDWWSVPVDADAFRGCLAAGFPIAFGTRVTESFVQTPRSGECGMPAGAADRRHGRHALLAVGYDDRRRVFVVRNSWGQDWGHRGHVYMPYAYVLNREWTSGCWALRLTARDAFDPGEHLAVDLRRLPKAPPGAAGGASIVGGAASIGAQVAIGAFTGSGLLAGLAGGLINGLTPGVSRALRGRDRGAYLGQDRSDAILAQLRGSSEAPPVERFAWDDGHDEEAIVASVDRSSETRRVLTSPRSAPRASSAGSPSTVRAAIAAVAAASPPPSHAPRDVDRRTPQRATPDATLVDALPEHLASFWRREGGLKGPVGPPVTRPVAMEEGPYRGAAVRFAEGAMFAWDPPSGRPRSRPIVLLESEPCTHAWLALGGDRSPVGWPVAEVESVPPEMRILKCARGSIVHHPAHGARAIHGALFAYWQQLGGLSSDLGAPTADAVVPADPREPQTIRFERGTLHWSAQRGAWRA